MSYPPPPEPFPESQPYPPPAGPAFQPPPPDPLFQPPQSGQPQSGPPAGSPQSGQPQSGPPAGSPQSGPPGPPAFQPGVASPSYPQTDHPQTGYQQPGYQQPGYPPTTPFPGYGPGQGPMPAPAPPGKPGGGSGALLWSLIAVFALLLCAGAGTAGLIAYRNSNPGTTALPSQDPVPPSGPGLLDPTAPPSGDPTGDPPTREPSAPADGAVVTYEVTGDGPVTIQYLKSDSQIESLTGERLPWRVAVRMPKTNFLVSLTASREGGGSGRITCRVLVDGKTVSEQTSGGTLAIVACLDFDLDFD
jgi:hypothetical protein